MAAERASFVQQTQVCFDRCVRGFKNDQGWKTFISSALITFLVGLVMSENTFVNYVDTKNGSFALVSACIWIGIFNSIRTVCRERDIVRREYRTGLNLRSYVVAHWLYEGCLCAAEALVVTVITRVMSFDHFIEEGVFLPPVLEMYVTFFLVTFSADALGLLVSSIVSSENTAMTVMPFVLIVQLVMSGAIFELDGVLKAISSVTISRWGLAAVCATAHANDMFDSYFYGGLEEQASTVGNLLGLWLTLLAFAVIYAVLSIVALSFVDER